MPSFRSVLRRLVDAAAFAAGLLLLFQVVAVTVDVLLRLLLDSPINGVTALTEWSLLYIAFLGAPWLQRENGHVSVDLLLHMVGPRASRRLTVASEGLGLVVTGVLVVFGTVVTYGKLVEGEYDFFKITWVPLYVIFAVIPFGAALWFLQILVQSIDAARRPEAVDRGHGDGL